MLRLINFQFAFADVKVILRQFPMLLALSGTVQKSQGLTLAKVVVDFLSPFVSPGQVYVAFSITRNANQLLPSHNED